MLNVTKNVNYTYKYMEYLDKTIKIKDFSLVKDYVIKEILSKNPNIHKKIILLLIKDIIKLDINSTRITFDNVELGKSNYKEYNKIIDSYVKINNNIHIDLECNTTPYKLVKLRNILYLNKMSTKILESGNNHKILDNVYLIQININTSIYDNEFGYEIYGLFGKKMNNKLTKFEHIIIYNIEYYRKLFYNGTKLEKDKMWLVVLTSRNFKELFNTLDYVVNKEEKNKLIKDVIEMFSDGFRLDDWKKENAEALNEMVRIGAIESAKEEGIEQGIQKSITNTIKSMLKEKCSFKLISKVTGKSFEEIKKIQSTIL